MPSGRYFSRLSLLPPAPNVPLGATLATDMANQTTTRRGVEVGPGFDKVTPVSWWYRNGTFKGDDEARGAFRLAYVQALDGMGSGIAQWMGSPSLRWHNGFTMSGYRGNRSPAIVVSGSRLIQLRESMMTNASPSTGSDDGIPGAFTRVSRSKDAAKSRPPPGQPRYCGHRVVFSSEPPARGELVNPRFPPRTYASQNGMPRNRWGLRDVH
jgi:hypothetical protein